MTALESVLEWCNSTEYTFQCCISSNKDFSLLLLNAVRISKYRLQWKYSNNIPPSLTL